MSIPLDQLNRPMQDLRISVIDRCNFRCTYCMPDEDGSKKYTFLPSSKWLSFNEIETIARLFIRNGVKKLRLTGGEPLLRPDLNVLIKNLSAIPNVEDVALTTNGSLLKNHADSLFAAGLNRLTVSLDALDTHIFQSMNGTSTDLKNVLDGIAAAEKAGFQSIKINTVIQKGVNDHQVMDLVDHFRGSKHILRFIEYMDVGTCNHWNERFVVPSKEILNLINKQYPLKPVHENYYGEVASRYRLNDQSLEVGFISSVSQPFCDSCTRVRLTTKGEVLTCLFAQHGQDLMPYLRPKIDTVGLEKQLKSLWTARNDQYSKLRQEVRKAPQNAPKLEMFQIGG